MTDSSTDKQITVDGAVWILPQEPDAADVFKQIEDALDNGTVARVAVLDAKRRRVEILINGRTVTSVVLDACVDPRPSETSI
ncbi:hypothetical protein ABH935_006811 [Catenulispora sp. GAS73]|uniref:hypothetical protein n=1 Tax=Catenulispora sp. GAS73 TaxID=3156269 RepID=UPI003510FAF8